MRTNHLLRNIFQDDRYIKCTQCNRHRALWEEAMSRKQRRSRLITGIQCQKDSILHTSLTHVSVLLAVEK